MTGSRDTFSSYDPVINFIFFAGAVVFSMFFIHPLFLICTFFLSSVYYLTVKGRSGIRLIIGMIPLFIFMSAVNPLLNSAGDTVMFTYFGGRPYTFEALCYGMALSCMFISVIIWFASYSIVMTSDKFMYIFGRTAPSLSLVFTMILRFLPLYRKKAAQISSARSCIGRSGSQGTRGEKIRSGMTILSALTSWALEGGIVTADSMRSRGYGSGSRTAFSIYRFGLRDMLLMAVMVALAIIVILCGATGSAGASYTPEMNISPASDIHTAAGAAAYFVFLSLPSVINITEEIKWNILRSDLCISGSRGQTSS